MARKVLNGLDLTSQRIVNVGSPSSAADAATKGYVDGLLDGRQWKQAVRAASTGPGTLATDFADGDTLDGVTLATGNRILVKNQADGAENGIYVVAASGAPVRSTDADGAGEIVPNAAVFVSEGTVNADTAWTVTNNGVITIGTTALTFAQVGGSGGPTYTAGDGIDITSDEISIDLDANSGLSLSGSGLKIDAAVVARKYAATVGNGSSTDITVTHNLGTRDVTVSVHDAATFEEVYPDVEKTDANTVTLSFAVAPSASSLRAIVIG